MRDSGSGLKAGCLLLLLLIGCASAIGAPNTVVQDRGDIHIGMVNAQSGNLAELGQGVRAGAQAVFDDVNARGGIRGRRLVLDVADDAYEPPRTSEETLRLIQETEVLALLGYVGTATTVAVMPMLEELGVPLVGVLSGASRLRKPVAPELFNLRASYDEEIAALVDYVVRHGSETVGVVYQNDGFGMTILAASDDALRAGGRQLSGSAPFERGSSTFVGALTSMMGLQPDTIILAGTPDSVAAYIEKARSQGLKSQFAIISLSGTMGMIADAGASGDGVIISQVMPYIHDDVAPLVRECRELLHRHVRQALNYVNFEGCANAKLLVAGIERAGPALTRKSLRTALDALQALDLGGLQVSVSPQAHQASSRVYLTQVRDGHITALP